VVWSKRSGFCFAEDVSEVMVDFWHSGEIVSFPYFSQSQLRSNLGLPDLSLGIDATPDLVWPSPAP